MTGGTDVLELLMPDASCAERERAATLTRFLRLLADDARGATSPTVRVGLGEAAREMERHGRECVREALEDLLRHHLHAGLSDESFLWFGDPSLDHASAWSVLEEGRTELPGLAEVPRPGERAVEVAARLLDGAAAVGMEPALVELWGARLGYASSPSQGRESLAGWLAGLRRAREAGASSPGIDAFVTDLAAVALDRGDVRAALAQLEAAGSDSPRAARLRSWAQWLLRPEAASDGPATPASPGAGPVPRALIELREAQPALLPHLVGPAAVGRRARPDRVRGRYTAPLRERSAVGAALVAWIRFGAGGRAEVIHVEHAPGFARGLGRSVESELAARDGRWTRRGQPEHALLLDAAPVVRHSAVGEGVTVAPPGALGAGTRALALAPTLDAGGRVVGWLHLEFEHLLVPSAERLMDLAREAPVRDAARGTSDARSGPRATIVDDFPFVRALFEEWVDGQAIKLQHRRWWGYCVRGGELVAVAGGGEGLRQDDLGGGGQAVARAAAAGGLVCFDEPDERLSLARSAGSGVALPARLRDRTVGLIVLESERRRDFRARDVERLAPAFERCALALRVAQFRQWHEARYGNDLCFSTNEPRFEAFARRLVAAGRSSTPVLLSGPAGVGKRTLARWLHFEGRPDGHLVRWTEAVGVTSSSGPRTFLVERLDALDPSAQRRLADQLVTSRSRPSRVRWIALAGSPLSASIERGELDPELAQHLDRVQLIVPPLCDRREDLPQLVRFWLERFSLEERLPAPSLDDAALALLWRQEWTGNLPELANALYKLVLERPGDAFGPALVKEVLGAFGIGLADRLPSRHPRRADVLAALRVTRRNNGRWNKTRAALYMGWDPDTLVARMKDLAIEDE